MIREIVKDVTDLSIPCKICYKKRDKEEVVNIIQDLKDTAAAYEDEKNCVGLASNQIGYNKTIIIGKFDDKHWTIMINPKIIAVSGETTMSEEGCLSLEGTRQVKRWTAVKVVYLDEKFKPHTKILSGFSGFIAQHEIDHLHGNLI